MITKTELTGMLDDMKSLKSRTEAAETKVKALETEKETLIARGGSTVSNSINSDEQRALRAFSKSHPKDLLEVNVADRKFKGVPDELKYIVLNLKRNVDVARMATQLFNGDGHDYIARDEKMDRIAHCKGILSTRFGREVLAPAIKAFGTTVVGGGAEWINQAVATTYLEEYELKNVLEARFDLINMPSNPFVMPKLKNVSKARVASEGQTNFAAAQFQTDKITLTAKKLEEFFALPEELTEDSAPDFLGAARDEVVKAQERAAESAIINGDADGSHQDTDTQAGGADLAEKAWDGLRKLGLGNSANGSTLSFGNAAATELNLGKLRGRMGKFGSDPAQCVIIVGPIVYQQLVNLPGVATIEKFGPMATVLKGALASYQGMPIINSEHFREDLNAAGVFDNVTLNRAGILIVNVGRHYVGQKRPIRVKLMPDLPGSDRMLVASYRRVAFASHVQNAVEKSVVYGIDIAK